MKNAWRFVAGRKLLVGLCVLSLSVGIGATAAAYATFDWLLDRAPHGVIAPNELVTIKETDKSNPQLGNLGFTFRQLDDLRQVQDVFTDVAAYGKLPGVIATEQGSQQAVLEFVSTNYFALLGVKPFLGRFISAADAGETAPVPVVLSYRFWRDSFGADVNAVGRTMRVNGKSAVVAGVTAPEFEDYSLDWNGPTTVWVALHAGASLGNAGLTQGSSPFILMIARLRHGNTVANAVARSAGWLPALTPARVGTFKATALVLMPSNELRIGRRSEATLFFDALIGISALVLLAGCSCVGNILIGTGLQRREEFALRSALGASAWQLSAQVAGEATIVGAMAAVGGLAIAYLGIHLLAQTPRAYLNLPLSFTPFDSTGAFDVHLLAVTTGLTIVAVILCGLVPAPFAVGRHPFARLRTRDATARPSSWIHPRFVWLTLQLTLAVWCGSVAATHLESLFRIAFVDSGYADSAHVIVARVTPVGLSDAAAAAMFRELLARVESHPEVKSAAFGSNAPFTMGIAAVRRPIDEGSVQVAANTASSGYFQTQGIPVIRGREFNDSAEDVRQGVIVNSVLARSLWPNENPVGQALFYGETERYVVGVVELDRCRDILAPPTGCVWRPFVSGAAPAYLRVRVIGSTTSALASLRNELHQLNGDAALSEEATVQGLARELSGRQRLTAMTAACLAVCAIFLCLVGAGALFVSVARSQQRPNAIRLALGARPWHLFRGSVLQVAIMGAIGGTLGSIFARWSSAYLSDQLYQTPPAGWWISFAVASLVSLAALVTVVWTTRRVVLTDPLQSLRTI